MSSLSRARSRGLKGSVALVAVVVVAALSVAGCSGPEKADPKESGSTTSPGSAGNTPGALKDESAAVLSWTPPAPVVKSEGKVEGTFTHAMLPATAEVISVKASDVSTILTWQLSSAADIPDQGWSLNSVHGNLNFPDLVRIVDPVGKKSYDVNTMHQIYAHCACAAYPIHIGPDAVRMTAEYPPLPATATSVSVRIPNFAPVSVPVTR
jgi:hypothetical protein